MHFGGYFSSPSQTREGRFPESSALIVELPPSYQAHLDFLRRRWPWFRVNGWQLG